MSDRRKFNIELRSDEIQDILGKIPPWLIRWGISVLSVVIIGLILLASFFKYPDRINSEIQLTTDNPPVYLVSRTTAKISEFFAVENELVEKGQLLVVLESGADYRDVISARELVEKITVSPQGEDTVLYNEILGLDNIELGNLQGSFAALQKSLQSLKDFRSFDKYDVRIKGKEGEAKNLRDHYNRLWDQRKNREQELELAQRQHNRNIELHRDGAISDFQLEESERVFLSQKALLEDARLAMSACNGDQLEIEQQIEELKISKMEELQNSYRQILEDKDKFLAALADWEQKYLMISPAEGIISLSNFWSVNQEVKEDSRVIAIVQETSGPILGKLILPKAGAGKVEKGQKVIIRFDMYPYMEYGMVSGLVKSVSLVPEENHYFVEVEFPEGLNTSYDMELEFTQEMTGQAEIITEVRSFLVRVVTPLKSVLNRNSLN